MSRKVFLIGSLLVALSSVVGLAQEERKPNQQGVERITTATNLVTVNVIVTDRNGRYITGLKREQWRNGTRQWRFDLLPRERE